MLYKTAKPQDLIHEISAANAEIRRQEERKQQAQKALDTLEETGESYVGENEDIEERKKSSTEQRVPA